MPKKTPVRKDGTNDQAPTAQEILMDSDAGKFIVKNKFQLIVGLILVVILFAGTSIYRSVSKTNRAKELVSIYEFSDGPLKAFREDKMSKDDLVIKLNGLKKEVGSNPAVVMTLVESALELQKRKHLPEAIDSIRSGLDIASSNIYANYILASNLAVLHEDNDDFQSAIDVLEKLSQAKSKFYEAKIYLDLGRLYKLSGNEDKSKVNLEYVLKNFPKDDVAKLARLYINKAK